MEDKQNLSGKKLYRSQENRMIGGVCGGVAEFFDIDPTLVRLIWVAITLIGGIGLLVYLAALIIIPNNPEQAQTESTENFVKDKSMFWGSLLIVFGLILLLKQMGFFQMFHFWNMPWQIVWAIFLILIGALMLFNRMREKEAEEDMDHVGKKLYRSRDLRMLSGVCGGLAEYFEIDVSVIRILWVIGTLASAGLGIFVYIVMIFIFPEQPEDLKTQE